MDSGFKKLLGNALADAFEALLQANDLIVTAKPNEPNTVPDKPKESEPAGEPAKDQKAGEGEPATPPATAGEPAGNSAPERKFTAVK